MAKRKGNMSQPEEKKVEFHKHTGCIVSMTNGRDVNSLFSRDQFNDKVTEIRRSGGYVMHTSNYGYGLSGTLRSYGDISIYIDHIVAIEDEVYEIPTETETL